MADLRDVLNIDPSDVEPVEGEEFMKGADNAVGIVDRDPADLGQSIDQATRRRCRARMGQRLVEGVPAARIVERLDPERHDRMAIHTARQRRKRRPEASDRCGVDQPVSHKRPQRRAGAGGVVGSRV